MPVEKTINIFQGACKNRGGQKMMTCRAGRRGGGGRVVLSGWVLCGFSSC